MSDRARTLIAIFVLLALWSRGVSAQTVVPVAINGDAANRVDIVFLGDGYTSDEMSQFSSDVTATVTGLLAQAPFGEYRLFLNVRRIDVASTESGASHPNLGVTRNTAFGANYNCGGVARLICLNTSKVLSIVQGALPSNERDLVIVLVNDTEYGGSGGSVTVASMNKQSAEMLLHELAHTFGQLKDEYGGPPPPACFDAVEPSAVNVTKQTDRTNIKWGDWIDPFTPIPTTATTNGVPGLFVGALYCDTTLYRPVYNSKMRSLGQSFWQVGVEQLIRRIYTFVDPIDGVSPSTSDPVTLKEGETRSFLVSTPQPVTHALNVRWWLDGRATSSATQYSVPASGLSKGSHSLQAVVTDPTPDVRGDPLGLLTGQATWTVTATSSSPDFAISADRTSLTLARGQSGSVGLTVTPVDVGLAADVTLSCAGMPDKGQCTITPVSLPGGSGPAAVTMTLTTTVSGAAAPGSVREWTLPLTFAWGLAVPVLVVARGGRRARRRAAPVACGLTLAVAAVVAACGGGSSSLPAPKPPGNPGTPPGTYTIVASAASGAITRTATVVLSVQ